MILTILFLSWTIIMSIVWFVPSVFNTKSYVMAMKILIAKGAWKNVLSISAFTTLVCVNRTLMALEDILFPSLKDIADEFFNHKNKICFVTGHQRSATTNVHKAISSLPDVTTGT